MADVLFVTVSCSDWKKDGAWLELERFVEDQQPRFILMVGDQVYLDFGDGAERIWPYHLGRRRRSAAGSWPSGTATTGSARRSAR